VRELGDVVAVVESYRFENVPFATRRIAEIVASATQRSY